MVDRDHCLTVDDRTGFEIDDLDVAEGEDGVGGVGGQGGRGRDVDDAQNDVGPPSKGVLGRSQSQLRPKKASDRHTTVAARRLDTQLGANERSCFEGPSGPAPRGRHSQIDKGEHREADAVKGDREIRVIREFREDREP